MKFKVGDTVRSSFYEEWADKDLQVMEVKESGDLYASPFGRLHPKHNVKEGSLYFMRGDVTKVSDGPVGQFKVGDKVKCLHPVVVCDDFKDVVGVVKETGGCGGGIAIGYEDGLYNFTQVAYVGYDGVVLVEAANQGQDSVNHPSHYNESGIECIEAIEATLGPDGFQAYCKGNCMKYLWRYQYKNGLEDLKKAQVYLSWMIESVEKAEGEN